MVEKRLAPVIPAVLLLLLAAMQGAAAPSLQALESRILPWCMHRLEPEHESLLSKRSAAPAAPTTADLRTIATRWNELSAGFRKVYLEALEIPVDYLMYQSPVFGIEIYYTTSGEDGVDTLDTLQGEEDDWWQLTSGSSGIPDYIDEVARALDSTWNMEIERFGFPEPHPYSSGDRNSSAYKVLVGTGDPFKRYDLPARTCRRRRCGLQEPCNHPQRMERVGYRLRHRL